MSEQVLIIGLGQIGLGYDLSLDPAKAVYTHARAFSLHSAFDLVGAVDPSAAQRSLFQHHYSSSAYPDIASALQAINPTVVVIASPTAMHSDALHQILLHSRPKVILCEKPLAYDLEDARRMVTACERAGVKLFVNYMRRADLGAIEVKRRIESGSIATAVKGIAWYSKGFLHNGSHFFNLLEFWLGRFKNSKVIDAGRLWDNQDPEPDINVVFERGTVVFQSAWEEAYSHYTIELLSPSGRLRYEKGGKYITWNSIHADSNFPGYNILKDVPEIIANSMDRYQWHVVDQLAGVVVEKPHTLCTGHQALATLEAQHKIINRI